jgi:flagellar basal-body rod modification protein FlgD
MPVETIGSVQGSTSGAASNIEFNDYMKIFLAQLSNQNPLEPVDNKEFLTQMAAFTELQVSQENSNRLDQMLNVMVTNQSVALLGKNVEMAGVGIVGEVTAVDMTNGQPALTLRDENGQYYTDLRISDVSLIQE